MAEEDYLFNGDETQYGLINGDHGDPPQLEVIEDRCRERFVKRRKRNSMGMTVFELFKLQYCKKTCCPRLTLFNGIAPASWGDISPAFREKLEVVLDNKNTEFDAENNAHMATLKELWDLGVNAPLGSAKPMPRSIRSPEWKNLGFQGEDPRTDFRGAGYLGLLATREVYKNPATAHIPRLMHKMDLFCAAGTINMAMILLLHLRILDIGGKISINDPSKIENEDFDILVIVQEEAMRGFMNLCTKSRGNDVLQTFLELVGCGMILVTKAWKELLLKQGSNPPNLMDFPLVLQTGRVHLLHFLAWGPDSMKTLRGWCSSHHDFNTRVT